MRKEKGQSKWQDNKRTQNTLSQVPNGIELIWRLREGSIYLMCLGVEYFALVLNEMFGMLGWLWMRWLGVFIAPNHFHGCWWRLLAMGAPDSPMRHRTDTVPCPVRRHVTQPLGFWAVDRWRRLSSCGTGQSGATPDSPVPLWLRCFDFCTALCCTIHPVSRPLVSRELLLR
jgi:hypothetical protein